MKIQTLIEQVQPEYLYHGTGIVSLGLILRDDTLYESGHWGRTGEPHGARLSRNPTAAANFSHDAEYQRGGLLCFSKEKLAQNHKIVPYQDVDSGGDPWGENEAEEVVIGPVKGVSKYLVSVIINPMWIKELNAEVDVSREMYEFYESMFGMGEKDVNEAVFTLTRFPINTVIPRGVPPLDMIPPNSDEKFA